MDEKKGETKKPSIKYEILISYFYDGLVSF